MSKTIDELRQQMRDAKSDGIVSSYPPLSGSAAYVAAEAAITSVISERGKQDMKWGEQNHDAGTWALILLEEIGEWAKAELQTRFGGPEAGRQHEEAVQMTAVALAVIECMNRKQNDGREVRGASPRNLHGLVGDSD